MPVVDVPDVELADDAGNAVTMVTRAAGDEPVTELLVCESQNIFTTTVNSLISHENTLKNICLVPHSLCTLSVCACLHVSIHVCACMCCG